jgi:membrane protein DedA with SNARE-associated domain
LLAFCPVRLKKENNSLDTLIDLLRSFAAALRSGQLPELGQWTYVILAMLVAVEGPIATLLGAAAASAGLMRPIPVFFAASVGNLTSDVLWYGLGYAGKIEWVSRFGQRMGIDRRHLERLERNLKKHSIQVIFLAKLTVSFSIPTLIAAGLIKAPWRKWFPAVCIAETIWTGSLVLLGYYATEAIKRVEQGVEYIVLFASAFFLVFLLWLGRRMIKAQEKEDEALASNGNE